VCTFFPLTVSMMFIQQVKNPRGTAGAILAALTDGGIDGDEYDRVLPARQRSTLY